LQVRDEFSFLDNEEKGIDVLLLGHTHRPTAVRQTTAETKRFEVIEIEPARIVEIEDRRWMLNPGSVGQPRDGDRRASYLILDLGLNEFELHRVEYDVHRTQKRMEELGLHESLIQRLDPGRRNRFG
jgi:diadenosine tetraphosphatase ApaH/serine/threonine PP2A family protein phosphatase